VNRATEQQAWIEAWARRIHALGLSQILLPLIDVAHAFGFLGSQALVLTKPLAAGIVDDTAIERAAVLLSSSELLEHLRVSLEGGES
jgi:hypothetical protein